MIRSSDRLEIEERPNVRPCRRGLGEDQRLHEAAIETTGTRTLDPSGDSGRFLRSGLLDHAPRTSPQDSPSSPSPVASLAFLNGLALRDPDPSAFEQSCKSLLETVDPNDMQAKFLTELLLLSADRVRRAALQEPQDALPDLAWCRFQSLADRNFRAALREWQRHQDRLARAKMAKLRADADKNEDIDEAEAPSPPPLPESTPEEIAEAAANWRNHIAMVRSVSEEWPILLTDTSGGGRRRRLAAGRQDRRAIDAMVSRPDRRRYRRLSSLRCRRALRSV